MDRLDTFKLKCVLITVKLDSFIMLCFARDRLLNTFCANGFARSSSPIDKWCIDCRVEFENCELETLFLLSFCTGGGTGWNLDLRCRVSMSGCVYA